jgi:hypothetical protein
VIFRSEGVVQGTKVVRYKREHHLDAEPLARVNPRNRLGSPPGRPELHDTLIPHDLATDNVCSTLLVELDDSQQDIENCGGTPGEQRVRGGVRGFWTERNASGRVLWIVPLYDTAGRRQCKQP